jgi:hypothetical protein
MTFDASTGSNTVLTSRVQSFRKGTGILASSVGFVVLLGWKFNVQALTSVYPGLATMKSITALGFLLFGCAVWLFQVPGHGRRAWRRGFAIAASVITITIGFLTLVEYWFHVSLGIDEFPLPETTLGEPFPGRMSPLAHWLSFCLGLPCSC